MHTLLRPLVLLLSCLVVACSDSNGNGPASGLAESRPQLGLSYSDAPIDLLSAALVIGLHAPV